MINKWLEKNISLYTYENQKEELANGWSHLAGALLSVIGMFFLIRNGIHYGTPRIVRGFIVFGSAMILLFSSSGFYHLARPSNKKRLLRVLDHNSIYILIAGTYTPILLAMDSPLTVPFLILIWSIALLGIFFKIRFWNKHDFLHVLIYLAMGWMILLIWKPFFRTIPRSFIIWIFAGGLTYTLGTLFYASKKIPFNHAIWHFFVLAGCGFFYWGILTYLR